MLVEFPKMIKVTKQRKVVKLVRMVISCKELRQIFILKSQKGRLIIGPFDKLRASS